MKERSDLDILSFLFVMSSLILLANIIHNATPDAHAQTNAAMLATSLPAKTDRITNNATSNIPDVTYGELEIKKGVKYFDNASGYLVYPSTNSSTSSTNKKLPVVIMIHENRGVNDNIRSMANTLAKQAGYVVFAVDLFKGKSTNDPNQANQFVQSVRSNPGVAIANLQTAVKYVSSLPFVNGSKIASIGWCFGGGQSLQLALHSEEHPLLATILYYGTPLITDQQQLSKIKWPVLGIFGDHDQANPLPLINMFKSALDNAGVTNQIVIYKGLGHAFANPSGANYAPQQTVDAWQKTLAFLKKFLND